MAENNLVPSPSGDTFRIERKWTDETMKELAIVGKVDIQKEIDERAKGCSIRDLIARAEAGDMSVFTAPENFEDVSQIPESEIDAFNQLKEATKVLQDAVATIQAQETKKEETSSLEKEKEKTPVEKKNEVVENG